jgi:hypothetical protein
MCGETTIVTAPDSLSSLARLTRRASGCGATRQRVDAGGAFRQDGLFDNQAKEPFATAELYAAARADDSSVVEHQPGLAIRVDRAAQNFEILFVDHVELILHIHVRHGRSLRKRGVEPGAVRAAVVACAVGKAEHQFQCFDAFHGDFARLRVRLG